MGFWGSALFSNDTTLDVRDTYKGFLRSQMSNEEAYEETLKECKEIIESDEESLFWLALAETQWRVGRLHQDVKAKALEWIEKKGGLEFWEDNPKGGAGWEKTLLKLKEKLESPMPKERRFPKVDSNPWNLHDVYAYRLHEEYSEECGLAGKYILLQKIGEYDRTLRSGRRISMRLQVIDHLFDDLPDLEDINKYRILPLESLTGPCHDIMQKSPERPLFMNGTIYIERPSEYPVKHLTFLGNIPGPVNKYFYNDSIGWPGMDYPFCSNYAFWQGREYWELEEGIYDYN